MFSIKSTILRVFIYFFLILSVLYFLPSKLYGASIDDFQILETSGDSILLVFRLPELTFSTKEVGQQTYKTVSFKGCGFTQEVGKARVPLRIANLGIPEGSIPTISIQDTQYNSLTGYKLYPVEDQMIRQGEDSNYTVESKFTLDNEFYSSSKFYPSDIAKIEPIGYLREQRIAKLELHPIQYSPSTGQLKIYKKIEIRIRFPGASQYSYNVSSVKSDNDPFETLYEDTLINYEQAKKWRKTRSRVIGRAPDRELENRYKITINKTGIYRLNYGYLKSVGIDPDSIDPRKVVLESSGAGVPIYIEGYEDGKFDPGDFIEFYGVKMDSRYTEENVYWLSWSSIGSLGTKSWLMPVKDGTPKTSGLTSPVSFLTTEHQERDLIYDPLKKVISDSADHFFWSAMRGQDPKYNQIADFPINLPYRTPGGVVNNYFKIRVNFQGITYARGASSHIVRVKINNSDFIAQWDGAGEFISEATFSQWQLNRTNWISMYCDDNNGTTGETDPKWDLYLNWVEIDYWRDFVAENNILSFSTNTIPPVTRTTQFTAKNFTTSDIIIYQIEGSSAIARILNPEIKEDGNIYTATFEDDITQPTRYLMTTSSSVLVPKSIVKDQPSTLYDPANRADYIMITHRNFLKSTERLAEFRRKQGLGVIVVDVEDIYDEFSYGIFDPNAIRRFLRYAYFNWEKIPTYVLLMGDAHWDYKYVFHESYLKYENYPRIYVPTYHGYNSPYGETAMDHRFVNVSGDDIIPDMFIGRIPAEKPEEADIAVDRIISYEERPYRGIWQSRIMLVADDEKSKSGDEVFEESRIELANDYIPIGFEVSEVYLRKIGEPFLARKMINMEINNSDRGLLMLEYSGHGGAHSWAHEYIFSWEDVKKLNNQERCPFVITTTCENGYFDNPTGGNKSIMELFLLQPNGGAIACLSATRLTYGQGNAAFDRLLYPRIFNEKPPILGKIITEAKIDFINLDISTWTPSAEQYTIFGDPATKLALPERNIDTKLVLSSVDVNKPIEIKPGYIKQLKLNPLTGKEEFQIDTNFNAQMRVSVVYPNNMDDIKDNDLTVQSEFVKVSRGEFGKVSIKVPNGAIPGEGRIRFYANSGESAAIGGLRFSVSNPVVEYFIGEFINDEYMQVYAAIVDNQGKSGIKSVECEWHNTETWKWHNYAMVPGEGPPGISDVEGSWYILRDNIPLSRPGTTVEYKIIVTDIEGNVVSTPLKRLRIPIGVNLAISKEDINLQSNISYSYSQSEGAWILTAQVENNGGKEVKKPIVVYFFESNPDKNKDAIVDPDANILGHAVIEYRHWVPGKTAIQTAKASTKLREPLASGLHQIFVWINPDISASMDYLKYERVEDADLSDDLTSKIFQVNEFLIGKENQTTNARSLDGSLTMVILSGSVEQTVMSITNVEPPKSKWEQVDLTKGPLPELSHGMATNAFKIQLASGVNSLRKPAQVEIKFDATQLREMAKKPKGLHLKAESQLTPAEKEWIEIATQAEAKKLGIYSWQEEIGMWRYLPSTLIMEESTDESTKKFAQTPYVTLPIIDNASDYQLSIEDIAVDEIITPIGNWVIFFISPTRYKVYFRREGLDRYESLRFGEVGKPYNRPELGIQIRIEGNQSFEYGDVYKFDTIQDINGIVKIQSLRSYVNGDGTARINIMDPDEFYDVRYVPGFWTIFFVGPRTYEIHSQNGDVLDDPFGYPFQGEVGKQLLVPNIGIKIEVYEGRWPFQFGDKFIFKTLYVGTIRTWTESLGTLTLFHSSDLIPPKIQLWVNKNVPQNGDVIPPNPNISIMLSDKNGIDVDSFVFLMSINGRDFNPVPKEDYVFSIRSGGVTSPTNVPIFYSPILKIGKYKYRLSAMDLNGNRVRSDDNTDYVEFMFLVEKQPDLKPPVVSITADGQNMFDGQVFPKSPKFLVTIEDDHALDAPKTSISLSYQGEEAKVLKKNEYIMTISEDLKKVTLSYPSDLINGEYFIQVKALDTSGNIGYLGPTESEPLKFRINQKVEIRDIMNYPNPFSEKTLFTYWLTQPAEKIVIKIYTLRGRLIKTIQQDMPRWKYNEEIWDGRDEEGKKLSSGVYLYKLTMFDGNRKVEKVDRLAIVR